MPDFKSFGQLQRGVILVQGDFPPSDICPSRLWSKKNFVNGDFCPRHRLDKLKTVHGNFFDNHDLGQSSLGQLLQHCYSCCIEYSYPLLAHLAIFPGDFIVKLINQNIKNHRTMTIDRQITENNHRLAAPPVGLPELCGPCVIICPGIFHG